MALESGGIVADDLPAATGFRLPATGQTKH